MPHREATKRTMILIIQYIFYLMMAKMKVKKMLTDLIWLINIDKKKRGETKNDFFWKKNIIINKINILLFRRR